MAWTDELHIRTTQLSRGIDVDTQPVVGDILLATSSGYIFKAISIPSTANFQNVLGANTGDTTLDYKQHYDNTSPAAVDASASAGTSVISARRDHVHAQDTALTSIDFLVGTATAELSAEIVVGTTPGGELGGTWASPTVDSTHSGSAHHDAATVADTASIDLTISGQQISGAVLPAGVDHNTLANLATGDVHTHYALLAGRSGGQTLKGDTASGGGLVLRATAHATPGTVSIAEMPLSNTIRSLLIGTQNLADRNILLQVGGSWAPSAADSSAVVVDPIFTGSADSPKAMIYYAQYTPSASITSAIAVELIAVGNPATGKTITNLAGNDMRFQTGSDAGAVTNAFGGRVTAPVYGSIRPTTAIGFQVNNQGSASITTAIGVDIAAQSGASTNYGLRSATVLVPSSDEGVNLGTTALRWGTMYGMVGTKYKARSTRTSTQTLTDKTFTKIQYGTEAYDPNNNFDSSTNYNYTAPKTGYYLVTATLHLVLPAAGVDLNQAMSIFVNGSEVVRGDEQQLSVVSATVGLGVSSILALSSTDTVDIRAYNDNSLGTGAVVEASLNDFAVHLLSVD